MFTNEIQDAITKGLDRIETETGKRPVDWLNDKAEEAQKNWTENGLCDAESVIGEIDNHVEGYIAFMKNTRYTQIVGRGLRVQN